MSAQIQYGRAQAATSDETLPALAEEPHFTTAVRFGRRKSDQCGHLVLTNGFLQFRGGRDLSVAWPEIARIDHTDRTIVVSLHNTRRMLLFSCATAGDAARGSSVARELAAATRRETAAFV